MYGLEQKTAEIAENDINHDYLLPLNYSFKARNLEFDCNVSKRDNNGLIIINITTNLGYLPYSSENGAKREEILKAFGPLIARGKITIDHHCNLTMPLNTATDTELTVQKC